ncbi:MAG: VWA domain-containing protein [Sedimentisphaerales bacterium]|nr:VWA domain-containing protein [Sedimentisphaerales bacterium]
MCRSARIWIVVIAGSMILPAARSAAQPTHIGLRPLASNVLVPQSRGRAFAPERQGGVEITKVSVLVDIVETMATTTVEIDLVNETNRRQEAELIVPVPDGAVVRGFAYDGPHGPISAEVLPRDEARRIYQGLVARIRDPALVEFVGYNLIRSSVFPVEPHGKQKVRLTYEHLLEVDGNRVDYILPRTESLQYAVPWQVTAHIKAKQPISTVYSASHRMEIERVSGRHLSVKVTPDACKEPGPFRLSYLLQSDGVTASLFAYPDRKVGGGYFLLLAGLPAEMTRNQPAEPVKREVTLVIDRSGSMRSEKIEQAKEAALQIIAGVREGESFNVIIYSNTVEWFSDKPVVKDGSTARAAQRYIEGITATGGTNIYDALTAALNQEPTAGTLPIVLFLTDGLPTVGQTSEIAIRDLVTKSNPHQRRVFTFGVGFDVNAALLEKIADESRARAEFVLPSEDVEVKVGNVFKRLTGPILASPELRVVDHDGDTALGRTRDILPDKLPDLFEGDRLVVLGQYVGDEPLAFRLKGDYFGKERTFKFGFDFDKASAKNGFVPRLWASRKIAELIDAVRQMGADPSASTRDPKVKELVDEIVRLSTEFGILTEYTAFLAREGTDLARPVELRHEASDRLSERALGARWGMGGVNQSLNSVHQKSQTELNMRNFYYDEQLNEVSISNVQQINDKAYYNRRGRWIDSTLVERENVTPARVIAFGSQEYFDLAERLARENRQGSIALTGDILLMVDGEPVLIQAPRAD